jgi:hypothetical protein
MFHSRKASISLSLNFIVTLIIAVVLFMLSLVFLAQLYAGTTNIMRDLNDLNKAQIEDMMRGGARVATLPGKLDTTIGNPVVFGVGIRNTNSNDHFKVQLEPNGIFVPAINSSISCNIFCNAGYCSIQSGSCSLPYQLPTGNIIYYQLGTGNGESIIPMNAEFIERIAVQPLRRFINRALPGEYVFNVNVCVDTAFPASCSVASSYDKTVHKLHLIVH